MHLQYAEDNFIPAITYQITRTIQLAVICKYVDGTIGRFLTKDHELTSSFIPNKIQHASFRTSCVHTSLRQALLQGHFTSTSTFGSVHLIFGFPREYRVCFVSVLGSSPPSLPVYVVYVVLFMLFAFILYSLLTTQCKQAEFHYSITLEG